MASYPAGSSSSQAYQKYFNNSGGSIRIGQSSQLMPSNSQTQLPEATASGPSESWVSSMIPSRQTLGLLGIVAAGMTLIGATTYFVTTRIVQRRRAKAKSDKKNAGRSILGDSDDEYYMSEEEEDLNLRVARDRKRRRSSSFRPPPLITFAELFEQALHLHQYRASVRKSKIYFDANDEFVREEQIPELLSARSHQDESLDEEEREQRLQDTIAKKYSAVSIFFGNEEHQISGTTRITRNIFAGTHDRNENALLFLENLNKVKQSKNERVQGKQAQLLRKLAKQDQHQDMMSQASYATQLDGDQMSHMSFQNNGRQQDEFNSDTGFESLDPVYEDQNSQDEDEVLLNISPNKFEKPKDQLYMDFFVKYTELFVNDNNAPRSKQQHRPSTERHPKMRLVATSSANKQASRQR